MTSASQILNRAASQIGVTESPYGSNRQKYGAWYGMNGAPWCDMFVSWVFAQEGASGIIGGKFAYCPYHQNWFRSQGRLYQSAKVGDIVFYKFAGMSVTGHVGIVEKVFSNGTFQTIEGNTSAGNYGSQNNGGGVYRRVRNYTYVTGFGRPAYTGSSTPATGTAAVKRIQAIVGATQDGVMGPGTKAKIASWQKAHRLTADGIWGPASERAYAASKAPSRSVTRAPITGSANKATVQRVQAAVRVAADGMWGPGTSKACVAVVNRDLSNVKYLQARVGAVQDGQWGPASEAARINTIKHLQSAVGVTADGIWGAGSKAAWTKVRDLNYGKY